MTEKYHLGLDLHLGGLNGLVLASLVAESFIGVSKLLLDHACATNVTILSLVYSGIGII